MRRLLNRALRPLNYELRRIKPGSEPTYDSDSLTVRRKHVPFLGDPRFRSAYARAMSSGQRLTGVEGGDPHIEWRVMVACWAAQHGMALDGDLVECGVNTGMMALAICDYVEINRASKKFYLFDTYDGIPEDQMSASEKPDRTSHHNAHYAGNLDVAKANFAPFPAAWLVVGRVPETLADVDITRVCYLSLDMNIAYPERAALEHFWPKLSPGAMVVLDDYAWFGHEEQRVSLDAFATSVGVEILALPTGQGLMCKAVD